MHSLLATDDCPNGNIQNIQRLQKLQNLAETLLDGFVFRDLQLVFRNRFIGCRTSITHKRTSDCDDAEARRFDSLLMLGAKTQTGTDARLCQILKDFSTT